MSRKCHTKAQNCHSYKSPVFHKIIIGEGDNESDDDDDDQSIFSSSALVRYFGFINKHKTSLIVKVSASREEISNDGAFVFDKCKYEH